MAVSFAEIAYLHGLYDLRMDTAVDPTTTFDEFSSLGALHDEFFFSGWATLRPTVAYPVMQGYDPKETKVHFSFCPANYSSNNTIEFRKQAQLLVLDTLPPLPGSTGGSSSSGSASGSSSPREHSYRHYRPPASLVSFWDDEWGLWLVLDEAWNSEISLSQGWQDLVGSGWPTSTSTGHEHDQLEAPLLRSLSPHEGNVRPAPVDWSAICDILLQALRCLQALHQRHLALVWTHPSCFTMKDGTVYIGRLQKAVATASFSIDYPTGNSSLQQLFTEDVLSSAELSSKFICRHLRYISPESALSRQISPMNDIYGWGVLAWELLTGTSIDGTLEDTDAIEFDVLVDIHRHVTSEVVPPLTHWQTLQDQGHIIPDLISCQLSDIVMLALHKDTDRRYHSFDALAYDLEKLKQIYRSQGDLTKFTVGKVDRVSRFQFPSFVVERASEFKELDDAYCAIKSLDFATRPRVMNVWGLSGVGKTRLVEEWARKLEASEEEAVVVARCKTDQLTSKPLTSFVQIFQSLLDRILTSPREDPSAWRQRIKDTLGSQYGVLVSLLPYDSRRLLHEDQFIDVDVMDLENFLAAFKYWSKRFLQLFATRERLLVLLVDDAQWMTEDEVNLWKHLLDSESPLEHVLVVSMTRTLELIPPPTMSGLSVSSIPINVDKLTEKGTSHFVNACFSNRIERASNTVSSLIYGQTGGSPFFLRTLLSQLVKEGVVVFDYGLLEWRFHVSDLHGKLEAKEVDEFLDRMITALPGEVKMLLKTLACLPVNGFLISHVAELLGKSVSDLTPLIDAASANGVLVTTGDRVKFSHDRQQSAATRLIPRTEAGKLHQQVSFFLRRPEFSSDYQFDACDHALAARQLGAPKEDEEELVSLVMESAKRAALMTTFSVAAQWVQACEDIRQASGGLEVWMRDHRNIIFRYLSIEIEIASVSKQFDWALQHAEHVFSHCHTVVEKLRVVCMIIRLLIAANRHPEAAERAFLTLRELGYDLEGTTKIPLWTPKTADEVQELKHALLTRELLPEDDELHLLMTLLCSAGPAIYFIRTPLVVPFFHLGLSLAKAASRPSGACPYLVGAVSVVCPSLVPDPSIKWALYELSREVTKILPITPWTGHALYISAPVGFCFHPLHEFEAQFPDTFDQIISLGDGDFGSYFLMVDLPCRALSRKPCDLQLLSKRYTQIKPFFSLSNRLVVHPNVQYLEDRAREKPLHALMDGVFTSRKEMEDNPHLGYHNGLYHMYELRLLVWFDAPLEIQVEKAMAGIQWDDGVRGFPPQFELAFLRAIILIRANVESPLVESAFSVLGDYAAWSSSWRVRIEFLKSLQQLHSSPLEHLLDVEETAAMLNSVKEHELCGLLNYYIADELRRVTKSQMISQSYIRHAYSQYETSQGYGYLQMLHRRFPGVCPTLPKPPSLPSDVLELRVRPSQASQPSTQASRASVIRLQETADGKATEVDGTGSPLSDRSIDSLTQVFRWPLLMKSSLALAQETDSSVLLCTLLRILCQNVRCDYAAIGLCDDENSSSCRLLAAGPFKLITPYNLSLTDEAVIKVCPSSIMLHVQRTGTPITTSSALDELRPDPFYENQTPQTLICLPITSQGQQAGVILLSSSALYSSSAQSESSKEVISTLATFACVTHSHHRFSSRLAGMVEQRTRDLSNALQTKARFLSQCSHELRSPLGAIMGLAAVLEASSGLTTVQRDHLRTISSSGEDLLSLISNILDHAKLESNSVTLEVIPMDLREVVETAVEMTAPVAQAKGVEVVLNSPYASSPPGMLGDPFRTKQVLLNLLSNAVKFTPPSTPSKPDQSVVVTWNWKAIDGMISIAIAVTDTGVGIPSSKLDKLFKSFSQIDESITRSYGGSGLGLVISRDLARLLGGDCVVHSELGKGSTFTFTILCRPDPKWTKEDIRHFPAPQASFMLCPRTPFWVENLMKDIKLLNCQPIVVDDDSAHALDPSNSDGLAADRPIPLLFIDTSIVDLAVLRRIRKSQPLAKMIFICRAVDLAGEMARLELSRESIVARPIKFQALYQVITTQMQPLPISDGVKSESKKQPAKKGFDKRMGAEMPLRILIVDDSAVNVEVCKRLLELLGYKNTESAVDGLEAVEAADRTKFDLIFLDLQMPVMDGYEAFERIKGSPLAGEPCCVSLSANADKEALEKCSAVGFFDICTKPIRMDKMRDILARAYEHRRSTKASKSSSSTESESHNRQQAQNEKGKERRSSLEGVDIEPAKKKTRIG